MNHSRTVISILFSLGMCLASLFLTPGCRVTTPIRVTETSIVTTYPPPTFTPYPTPASCCVSRDFPPVCDIVPGQSTSEDVKQGALGFPLGSGAAESGINAPAGSKIDTHWAYPYGCPLVLSFEQDTVSVVGYSFKTAKSLAQAVDRYGPPEKVQAIWFFMKVEGPGDYWIVAFLWPTKGIIMEALLSQPIEDPHKITPFPANLPLTGVWHFEPTDLENAVSTYYNGEVLIDWPGME